MGSGPINKSQGPGVFHRALGEIVKQLQSSLPCVSGRRGPVQSRGGSGACCRTPAPRRAPSPAVLSDKMEKPILSSASLPLLQAACLAKSKTGKIEK